MSTQNLLLSLVFLGLLGCDQINQKLGLEDPEKKAALAEAEGKAVGSACRHSGRAIEDCYAIYSWLPKAAVFGGWREMDSYMRENQLETVTPQLPPPESPSAAKKRKKAVAEAEAAGLKENEAADGKPVDKGTAKH